MTSPVTKKTIFFIRHAESQENVRLKSLKTAAFDIAKFSWPRSSDLQSASELLHVADQVDSPVSEFGKQQIEHMATVLKDSNFIEKIEWVVHSPLLRAVETSYGMLGCKAPDTTVAGIDKVIELDLLREKTPKEWFSGGSFKERLGQLEAWLGEQPATSIAVVGHSQYFRALLKLDYLFGNCDVVRAEFDPESNTWSNVKEEHTCRLEPVAPVDTTVPS